MRAYDNGSYFTVLCTRKDVEKFARQWPGFGPVQPITYQYEKDGGDLTVCAGAHIDENDDGGLLALSEDARRYGEKKLGITTVQTEVYGQ